MTIVLSPLGGTIHTQSSMGLTLTTPPHLPAGLTTRAHLPAVTPREGLLSKPPRPLL